MSRRQYATKRQIEAAVEAARQVGLLPMDGHASIELAPDGRIRLSPPPVAEVDEWSKLAADARA